jgi:hypothetical protein
MCVSDGFLAADNVIFHEKLSKTPCIFAENMV